MRILGVLAIVLVAFVGWHAWRGHQREARLGAIASQIAGRPVSVDCQGFFGRLFDIGSESGSVRFDAQGRPGNTAHLKGSTCDDLDGYGKRRADVAFACVNSQQTCPVELERTVLAVLVLAHESAHLSGVRSESLAQCHAVQRMSLVAEELGSPHDEAVAVARHFLAVQEPRVASEYHLPAGCHDGGPLDLDPRATGWPSP